MRSVEQQEGWMQSKLADFMSIPSVLGAEKEAMVFVEHVLRGLELDVDSVPMSASVLRRHHLASSFDWDVTDKRAIVGHWQPTSPRGRSLVLSGHVDVLPPPSPSLWPIPPYQPVVDPEKITGWGGLKAGLIAMLGALRALRAAGLVPGGVVRVQAVPEEETGGNGALAAALSLPPLDAALVAGAASRNIATAQFGVAWLRVHVEVPPGHASTVGDDGSAIVKAMMIVERLRKFADQLAAELPPAYAAIPNAIGFNMGVIQGGTAPSLSAGECTVRCRIGVFPGISVHDLLQRAQEAVADFAAQDATLAAHPPTVVLDGFAAEPYELEPDSEFVATLAQAHRRAAGEPSYVTSTTATDTRIFTGLGIPAICVGPAVENLHGVQETVRSDELIQSAKVVAMLITEWCGVDRASARPDSVGHSPDLPTSAG